MQSPITYNDGYIYFGGTDAAGGISGAPTGGGYFCVSTEDEDTDDSFEVKEYTWKSEASGYYWGGGVVVGDKIYFAKIKGCVTKEDADRFALGVDIGDDSLTLPAKLSICSSGEISEIRLTLREGRFHQVKRMFQAVGKEVIYLKRVQMGGLALDETLRPGEYRRLTEEEVERLCSRERKL